MVLPIFCAETLFFENDYFLVHFPSNRWPMQIGEQLLGARRLRELLGGVEKWGGLITTKESEG